MKRILPILLILCLCLGTLAACSSGEEGVPDGMKRARSAAMDLWLFYPESWALCENGASMRLVSAEQLSLENQLTGEDVTDGEATLPSHVGNVTVMKLKEGLSSLSEYAVPERLPDYPERYILENEGEPGTLGVDETLTYTYHFLGGDGAVLYRFSQMLILHKGAVYALTLSATPSVYEELIETFGTIASSVTFEEVSGEDNTPLTEAPDPTVPDDSISAPEGRKVLTSAGIDWALVYPENGWEIAENTGFTALTAPDGASVSVTRGDAYAVQLTDPAEYLDTQFYASFDAFYGAHTEVERTAPEREDARVCRVIYSAEVDGEAFEFLQAMYLRRGYLYTLLYTAKAADFDAHLADAETMISEFQFK